MTWHVDKLTPVIGGEVVGLDLSAPLSDETAGAVRAALGEHGVLVFRGQPISDAAHVRFARHFGSLSVFRAPDNAEKLAPEIFRLANTDAAGTLLPADSERLALQRLNWQWHSDSSYRALPSKGAVLHGIEVVEEGGDTLFANMAAAYEALPAATKARVTGLYARHNFEFQVGNRGLPPMGADELARLPPVDHPLVRQHEDGRRSLYLSPPYMETIVGWNREDSQRLVAELEAWSTQDDFVYRHRWQPHDVLVWDNAWTMHKVTSYDMAHRRRVLHGTVIQGDKPVHPATA
jgi:alpha-ketoglutarate-dependent taurine dioxygenase